MNACFCKEQLATKFELLSELHVAPLFVTLCWFFVFVLDIILFFHKTPSYHTAFYSINGSVLFLYSCHLPLRIKNQSSSALLYGYYSAGSI